MSGHADVGTDSGAAGAGLAKENVPSQLAAPVTSLSGIGPNSAEKLARLGVETVRDLLLHLPYRYQDRTRSVPLHEVVAGRDCVVTGEIRNCQLAYGRRRSLAIRIGDGHGELTVRLFHFGARQREAIRPGLWLRCFGEARPGPTGLEMVHPEYRLHDAEPPPPEPALVPVYRTTAGLAPRRIGAWVASAMAAWPPGFGSELAHEFARLEEAIRYLHDPGADGARLDAARERVVLDELLGHYFALKRRRDLAGSQSTLPLPPRQQLGRKLLDQLGFRLTRAQARVTSEVLNDLALERPMMRLLQGDVGAGKTVVAAFAAIRAAEHGCQTAVMAPTEVLAEQHFETLGAWLSPLGIDVGLITGRQSAAERKARLAAAQEGRDLVVVGTHALFQQRVLFQSLALTVIDEQHRFGVHQRMQLLDKGRLPHQLVMTATPIPRTLTMALYADMDVSVLDELPPGRTPVRTRLAAMPRRPEVIERVRRICAAGHQAYWVCTLIEEEEGEDANRPPRHAAETTLAELRAALPPKMRLALAHGRLPPAEKSAAMAAFKAGEIDLLVATTVVEVGVDVPNATLMVIDNAEALGLAQLHQLRGRVGRGTGISECILLFEPPLSALARQRLATMRESNDGFLIAERDLALRGPGDMLGTRQTGDQLFKLADLAADRAVVPKATALGQKLLAEQPATAAAILETWAPREVEYAGV